MRLLNSYVSTVTPNHLKTAPNFHIWDAICIFVVDDHSNFKLDIQYTD